MPITNDYGDTVVVCNTGTRGITHARWNTCSSSTLCGNWAFIPNSSEEALPLDRVECKRCLKAIERLKRNVR